MKVGISTPEIGKEIAMRKLGTIMTIALALTFVGSVAQAQNTWDVNAGCAASGSYGFEIIKVAGQTNTVFVEDDTPDNEAVYRMQYDFNTDTMTVPHRGKYMVGVALQEGAGQRPAQVLVSYNITNGWKVWVQTAHNNTIIYATPKLTLNPGVWQTIMVEWRQSQGGGIDDGLVRVTNVSTGETAEITDFRNSNYAVGRARIGLTGRASVPNNGSHCFDNFESFRTLAP
jgi:hypothetical protein